MVQKLVLYYNKIQSLLIQRTSRLTYGLSMELIGLQQKVPHQNRRNPWNTSFPTIRQSDNRIFKFTRLS